MNTLRLIAIVSVVAGASFVACGSDDDDGSSASGGTGGGETGGTGGGETGGTGGGETGGTGGGETGGTGGGAAGAAGAPLDNTCVQGCIEDNSDSWKKVIDYMAPCVCKDTVCGAECEGTWCKEPIEYAAPPACGNCALSNGQTECMAEMGTCLADAACSPALLCLMACQNGG
jgi:hypothetical protein